jgi:hypothetical protein
MPVLAKQAIEGTSLIENSQIFIAIFRTGRIGKLRIASSCPAGADPICYAISGHMVIIPTNIGMVRCGSLELVCFPRAQPTVAPAPGGKAAFVYTNLASPPCFALRVMNGEIEPTPSLAMSSFYIRKYGDKVLPNTIETYP